MTSGVATGGAGGASCPPRRNFGEKWGNGAFVGKWGKEGKKVKAAIFCRFKGGFSLKRSYVIALILTQNTNELQKLKFAVVSPIFPVFLDIFPVLFRTVGMHLTSHSQL